MPQGGVIGNKGRTDQTTPPEKVKQLAQALITWSEEPTSCHLNQFTGKRKKCWF